MKVSTAGQLSEVTRELALRRNTYPRLIGSRKMKQSEADLCMQRMEAVHQTLMFCQAYEADIRAFIAAKNGDA